MTSAPVLALLPQRLTDACGLRPGVLCQGVLDSTHSQYLASGAQVLFATPLRIALILVVALVVRALLHRAIRRLVSGYLDDTPSKWTAPLRRRAPQALVDAIENSSAHVRRQQRAETVSTLLRSIVSFIVLGIAVTEILGELGINLAPIVASAGILGVAVGFGAQNLIRDFLTGIFMILEDQYGVGDVVDIGPATGTVEAVGLRTTRIRDVYGTVWYVRNGAIDRTGNKSQGHAVAVVDVPIAFGTPVEPVRAVVQRVADEVFHDDAYAGDVLEAPEVVGVETMDRDGLTLRVTMRTAPLRQWTVQRRLRERISDDMDAAGLERVSATRSMTVPGPDAPRGTPVPPGDPA